MQNNGKRCMTSPDKLDLIFKALSDQTRRALLKRLSDKPASISELALPLAMSLPAASKHIKVLERANLVSCQKLGRVHYCKIKPKALSDIDRWLGFYRSFWEDKLDHLEAFVSEEKK